MIYGEDTQKVLTAIEFIASSPILFYLTGSRFFGTQKEDSDWDFFTQQNEGIESILEDAGFVQENETYKGDPIITKVFKRENVHVQIVTDVRMKYWIQYKMKSYFFHYRPDKEMAKHLWSIGTLLYLSGMSEQKQRTAKLARK